MIPLEPKPPDPCPVLSSFLFWSSSCPVSSLNFMHPVTRVQGVSFPLLVVDCSSLGNVSPFVRPGWSIQSLRTPPLKTLLAFFEALAANLGFSGDDFTSSAVDFIFVVPPIFWDGPQIRHRISIQLCEVLSFGRITVLINLVVYGVLVAGLFQLAEGSFLYTTPLILLWYLLPTREPKFALAESRWLDWQIRSIRFDLCSLLFFRQIQVCSPLPPFFLTVLIGYFRILCSIVVWCIIYRCCMCRIGLPRCSWPWNWLRLICLRSVDILDGSVYRSYGYVCLWLACPPVDFSTFWCAVRAWVLGFSLQGFGDWRSEAWMWFHRNCVPPNKANQFLCFLNQSNYVVMHMPDCRFPCYVEWHNMRTAFWRNGSRLIPGSVVSISVAPFCGEQPWLIAPGFLLPFFHGSMMRISLSEIFGFNLLRIPIDGFRPKFYGSLCGNVRVLLFNLPIRFGFLRSSQPVTSALDDSFNQWLKCFQAVSLSRGACCTCKRPQVNHTFQVKGTMSCTGICSLPAYILLRPNMQIQANNHVIGKQDPVLGKFIFMAWLHFDIYWVYRIVLFLLSIVLENAVIWFFAVLSYLLYDYRLWFVWFVTQHDCELGMCLMALEQHRRMLGLAYRGLGLIKNQLWTLFSITNAMYSSKQEYSVCIQLGLAGYCSWIIWVGALHINAYGPCLLALVWHRWMPGIAHDGFDQRRGIDPRFISPYPDFAKVICIFGYTCREEQFIPQSETFLSVPNSAYYDNLAIGLGMWPNLEMHSKVSSR